MSTGALKELQRVMFKTITSLNDEALEESASLIQPSDKLSSSERVQIYSRQYFYRLHDCLLEDFPAVFQLLGVEKSQDLARRYLKKFPSRSYSLNLLGENFATFLAESGVEHVIVEMAQLEWAHAKAFIAADTSPLQAVEPTEDEELTISLHPSVSLLRLTFAVDEFKTSLIRQESPPSRKIESGRRDLVIYRPIQRVIYERIDSKEMSLLESLENGVSLERFVQSYVQQFGDAAGLEGMCATWSEKKWVSIGRAE